MSGTNKPPQPSSWACWPSPPPGPSPWTAPSPARVWERAPPRRSAAGGEHECASASGPEEWHTASVRGRAAPHWIKRKKWANRSLKQNTSSTRVFTCSLRWPGPTAPPPAAPPPPDRCRPWPPAAPAADSPPEHTNTHTITRTISVKKLYEDDQPSIITHQSLHDSQQHVEGLDPRFDVLPLWRQNHHRLHVPPREVVVVTTWNTHTHTHTQMTTMQSISSKLSNHSLVIRTLPSTYRQTQPGWTGWWRLEGGRCSRTCCRSYRCWPRTGWRRRRPAGAWPSKTPRRGRTSSSSETSVRRRKQMDGIFIFLCVCVCVCASSSLSPPPPAGHPMGCLQFSAPACPLVWLLTPVKLDLGTPRPPPDRQRKLLC